MVGCCAAVGEETKYADMDFSELTKIISRRVQKLEPDNAVKIMGCILLKEPGEQEMLQLAIGHENILVSKINDAKAMLSMLSPNNFTSAQMLSIPDNSHQFGSHRPSGSRPFSSPASFHVPAPYWDPQLAPDQHTPLQSLDFGPRLYTDSVGDDYSLRNQPQFLGIDEQLDNLNPMGSYYYPDAALAGEMTSRTSRRSQSLSELPMKTCHYYVKGFCKHGVNCRYSHGLSFPDGYLQAFSPGMIELPNEDHAFTPGSLENLEMEIIELLRSRRGSPVSIASLPMLYYEKYGRNLQAEGYLTESQRHGKAGFSLTKLLARLKYSIRLIDRPHGQHSVILAEDAHRYMECRNERSDLGSAVASSHQIYLTFPADSTFTEQDVVHYFRQYGPVRDVRIPSQDRRMFGFVSFHYAQTVQDILMKRNPHFICNSRVLVKPYREKSRIIDRTCMEKLKPAMYYPSQYSDVEPELHAISRESDSSRMFKSKLIEQEKISELERRRLSELNLASKPLSQQPYPSYDMEEFKVTEDGNEFPLIDHFSYTLDSLNNGSTSDDKARQSSNSYSDQESGQIELPESPFASPPIENSISAVI
ncbi:zinc finger CCCH domain-containing protein 18-like isoform X2 [Phoenix dactylifera]|uniref:Zinc finger CCCH domain-containing protein 18-like isoform X2 n=1 Tax=Phoenix dactylifera TaxID=42345 RepID=A0A8B7CJQ2_PHODC|nr:zinc finger CCCH domain-containing protein 18-like isoform X2 [Phoenix dactylifera]